MRLPFLFQIFLTLKQMVPPVNLVGRPWNRLEMLRMVQGAEPRIREAAKKVTQRTPSWAMMLRVERVQKGRVMKIPIQKAMPVKRRMQTMRMPLKGKEEKGLKGMGDRYGCHPPVMTRRLAPDFNCAQMENAESLQFASRTRIVSMEGSVATGFAPTFLLDVR